MPGEEINIPRQDLKRIIARVRRNNDVSLQDKAELAALLPRSSGNASVETLINCFGGNPRTEQCNPDALRTFGLLTEVEANQASSRNGIPFSRLGPKLQQHLFESIFHNASISSVETSPLVRIDEKSLIPYEITLLAPTGILNDAPFHILEERSDLIVCPAQDDDSEDLVMTPRAWGQTIYQKDHPKLFPNESTTIKETSPLKRLVRTEYIYRLQINRRCEWKASIAKVSPVNGSSFTIRNLPDDLRAEFELGYKDGAAMAEEIQKRKQNKNGDGDGDGSKNR